jgi:hypothetical protein
MEQNLTVDLSAFFNSGITPIDLSKNTNFSGFYSLKQAESLKVIKVPLLYLLNFWEIHIDK